MRHVASARGSTFTPIRLSFARYLTLAFELQLAGRHPLDGSGTERIGKLAAIAVIRTALNYFLSLEMKDERAADQAALRPHPVAPDASRA